MLEKFVQYFVKRHLLTNLIFIAVLVGGILSWGQIKKEEMPDVTFDRVHISASYPGATAEEVEHFVTRPLEDAIQGIDGVYRITSTASQARTAVTVEIAQDYPNKDEVITEIRNAVSGVDLPDDVRDDPSVRVFKTTLKAIIDIAVYDSNVHLLDVPGRRNLQKYAHALETQLLSLPQINSIDKSGYLKEEIQIKVDPQKLIEYDVPLSQVMREVRSNHLRQPAGYIEAPNEPKVTLDAQLNSADRLEGQIIQAGFEGLAIPLKDFAVVEGGFAKDKQIRKVNGHEAVIMRVVKNTSAGILDSVNAVNEAIERFRENHLQDTPIRVIALDDESVDLRNRLSIIATNGTIGFILILVMLFTFLNKRSGLWVAMGIPFSVCFTLVAARLFGYTINNVTLSAVIIVMGMVVDDAIVVAENIGRLRFQGISSYEAVVKGTTQVFLAIVASILTTCVAFVPLYHFSGRFGQLNRFIPPIIFLMLGASLFESLVILPGHMHLALPKFNHFLSKKKNDSPGGLRKHWFDSVESKYEGLLVRLLPHKGVIMVLFVVLLVVSALLVKHKMRFVMFPHEETREITITGYADARADRYDTATLTQEIENIIRPYIGNQVIGMRTGIATSRSGGAVEENHFRTIVEILPVEKRKESADQLIELWKKDINKIEGFRNLVFQKSRWGQASGSPIEILVQENDDALRASAVDLLVQLMKGHPDLIHVDIEQPMQIDEYKIGLQRERVKRLAISPADISSTFRAALEGAVLYELPRGDEEIDVRLTIIDDAKRDIESVLDVPVENRNNYLVPLRDLVTVEKTTTPNSISRRDRKRTTTVYTDITPASKKTPLEIAHDLENNVFPRVIALQPTTVLDFTGEVQDTRESGSGFRNAIILACLLIFMVLAILFNSLTRPLIIMLAIPFGAVGIVLAFLLHGKFLFGFFAAVGALGLAGVVINDSIVLLVKLDEALRKNDARVTDADIACIAKTRLRAVILTTVTTVAGVLPTAYGLAGYDAMMAEMMFALAWGLCFSTLITLLLVPCIYSYVRRIEYKVQSIVGGGG